MTKIEERLSNSIIGPALVSVVVPAYNGQGSILNTIKSVVIQNYEYLQLIVVDDASADSTSSLVEGYMKEKNSVNRFDLLRHETNMGLSKTLNEGLSEAKGNYVLILHQDCQLIGDDWVKKAVSLIKDERIAVVTGYYGVSDAEDESFVKRAFGVLRKQFHSRPQNTYEEATFSEGKCDLYRKDLLLKVGGFPAGYRIAGEDLVVSYKLRRLGYRIVKCYDLPVIQRFTGAAESFKGNLEKEFLFGKVMGGVFSEFKFFLFKGVKNSEYSRSRSLHRASQPAFISALVFLFLALFSFPFTSWLVYVLLGLLFIRYLYHMFRVFGELKVYKNPIKHRLWESLIAALIGILTDFVYSFGFGYGLVRRGLGREL